MNRKDRRQWPAKANAQQIQFFKVERMLEESLPKWYQWAIQRPSIKWAFVWMCRVELQQRPKRNVYTCYFLGKNVGETSVNHI